MKPALDSLRALKTKLESARAAFAACDLANRCPSDVSYTPDGCKAWKMLYGRDCSLLEQAAKDAEKAFLEAQREFLGNELVATASPSHVGYLALAASEPKWELYSISAYLQVASSIPGQKRAPQGRRISRIVSPGVSDSPYSSGVGRLDPILEATDSADLERSDGVGNRAVLKSMGYVAATRTGDLFITDGPYLRHVRRCP